MILETPKGTEDGEDLDAVNLRSFGELGTALPSAPSADRVAPRSRRGLDEARSSHVRTPIRRQRRRPRRPLDRRTPRPTPSLFINRELSWLDFNERVLEEARDPSNPLLERLRFLAISASNLDEFFEVRVAGLQAQLYDNLEPQDTPPDGLGPLAQLTEISRRAHDFVARQYEIWRQRAPPRARQATASTSATPTSSRDAQNAFLDDYFDTPGLPGPDPAGDRPGAPVPAPAQQEPQPDPADRDDRPGPAPAALRGAPGPLGPQPAGPAARRGRRPAPVRAARRRDRPPARRPLRRLQGRRPRRPSA